MTAIAFPTLTRAERDRRYALLRTLMDDHGLDALLVSGMGRDQLDRYITNEGTRGLAVLPRHGEPVTLVGTGNITLGRHDAPGRAYDRWVADQRLTSRAYTHADVLTGLGLATARIGVVGLSSRAPASIAGTIPYTTWKRILDALPGAAFTDVAGAYEQVMMVHGPEEIAMIRHSAAIGEHATAAMLAAAGEGVRESEIVAAGMHEVTRRGGMWLTGPQRAGSERLGWAGADWVWMGGGGRVLQRGDAFGAELFTFYGGFETQQQVDLFIGEPDDDHRFLHDVAAASYRAGVDALRPGATFADLCAAMEAPLREAGCWNMGPLVQTVSPVIFNSATHVGLDTQPGLKDLPLPHTTPRDGDFELVPGIAFAFEPNACLDRKRVCLGGTVLYTEQGPEELNTLCNRLNVIAV